MTGSRKAWIIYWTADPTASVRGVLRGLRRLDGIPRLSKGARTKSNRLYYGHSVACKTITLQAPYQG